MLLMQEIHHGVLVHEEDGAFGHDGRTPRVDGVPARQPSPKNEPSLSIATMASRPPLEATESFTSPFWMYRQGVHGSPCTKMAAPR